jgi:hypothetical protein
MPKIKTSPTAFILWSTLAGTISFFIGGAIVLYLSLLADIAIIDTVIAGAIGGLLLGVFLWRRHKIGTMTIAGVIAIPVGFWTSFALGYAISEIPFIANTNVPNILFYIIMGALVGALFGTILYGPKSIWLFALVCGAVSEALVFLTEGRLDNLLKILGVPDLNLFVFILSFGIGIGLSIGLYEMLKQKKAEGA